MLLDFLFYHTEPGLTSRKIRAILSVDVCLQGGVQVPTGGTVREPFGRTGEIPVPTVKVWMEEDEKPFSVVP